ncbi:MAG: hypothetical protein PHY31_01280 [Smithellaceae bacterium]|nr:hypothetical protein [Smithellaceae bacterium]
MQKPSLGFDYLKRISSESGDFATLALQGRVALTEDINDEEEETIQNKYKLEPQVYNAYAKFKTPWTYLWIGHNRPAISLGSYFDSHGLILRTLAIQGFGYDRDWGVGFYRDFSWGDFAASATTGTGMPVYFKGNFMTAARISYGVLSQENFNIGLSFGYGDTLDTMGYELRNDEPQRMTLGGVDVAFLRDIFENRFDLLAGKWLGEDTFAVSDRVSANLDPEGLLKLEFQPTYWKFGEEGNYQLALCASSQVTSNLTVRLSYTYDRNADDNIFILQLYYYRPI